MAETCPIVTFLVNVGASCRALGRRSTICWVFRKHFWLGLPLVRGGQITTFIPKTGVKYDFLTKNEYQSQDNVSKNEKMA